MVQEEYKLYSVQKGEKLEDKLTHIKLKEPNQDTINEVSSLHTQ